MSYDAYPWPSTITKGALVRAERVKQIVLALQADDLNALQIEELVNIRPETRRKSMQPLIDCGLVMVAERIGVEKGHGMAVFRVSSDEARVAHYLASLGNPEKVRPTNVKGKRGSGVRSVDQPLNPGWKFRIPPHCDLMTYFFALDGGTA